MSAPSEQAAEPTAALTRREYEALVRRGVLDDARVELLGGRLVSMSPQGEAHSYGVNRLARLLIVAIGDRALVRIQTPLALSDTSEPEPDIAVVPPGDYLSSHPAGAWLVVEVADSSLDRDRKKAAVYAAAGVEQFWIVNLGEAVFEVHAGPSPGGYQAVTRHARGAALAVPQLDGVVVRPEDVLPPV